MNSQVKTILKVSIAEYKKAPLKDQIKMHAHVKNELARHEEAVKNIGMGLERNKVQAAELFLRIYPAPPVLYKGSIDRHKFEARQDLKKRNNYNIFLIVSGKDGKIKAGRHVHSKSTQTDICAMAIDMIKSKPVSIAGLE